MKGPWTAWLTLWRVAARQDLRAWGPYVFASGLALLVLGAPLFDVWAGEERTLRSWALSAGLLEAGLVLGIAGFGCRPAVFAVRSGAGDALRVSGPGWGGWVMAEAAYASARGLLLLLPSFLCVIALYTYMPGGGGAVLPSPGVLAGELGLEALPLGCLVVCGRRFLPAPGAALVVLAAAALARAAGVPALRALVPPPLPSGAPVLASVASSLLAAAGLLLVTTALPPECGRT